MSRLERPKKRLLDGQRNVDGDEAIGQKQVVLTALVDHADVVGSPRSRELERYQQLTPEVRPLRVNLIATEVFRAKRARKKLAHLPAQCAAGMHQEMLASANAF